MSKLRSIFKQIAYLPIHPLCLKPLIQCLRWTRWLPVANPAPSQGCRILVSLPYDSLGDLVLSVRFLEHLHQVLPAATIDVVVGSKMTSLFNPISFLNRVISYELSSGTPPLTRYRNLSGLLKLAKKERLAGAYDLALDPRWDSDGYGYIARVLVYLSGARKRIAYSGHVDSIDPSLDAFLTRAAHGGEGEHELIRKIRLLRRAGITREEVDANLLSLPDLEMISLAELHNGRRLELLKEIGISSGECYGVLAPGATSPRRIWPLEHVAATAQALHQTYGLRFLIIGSPGDTALADRLSAFLPEALVSVAGQTDIPLMAALLSRAAIFIGNDSGPAHLAGILETNTVVISPFSLASTEEHINSPVRFRPGGSRVRVLQPENPLPPCQSACVMPEAHCILQISAEEAITACENLLNAALTGFDRRAKVWQHEGNAQ